MKATLDTINLIRDLTTTTIKIADQEKFDVSQIMNYGPYVPKITNIKKTVSAIPDEFRQADTEAIKAVAGALIDGFFIIREHLKAHAETLQTEQPVLQ